MANLIVKGNKTNVERTISEDSYKRLVAGGFAKDLTVVRRIADKPADLVKARKAKTEPTGSEAGPDEADGLNQPAEQPV